MKNLQIDIKQLIIDEFDKIDKTSDELRKKIDEFLLILDEKQKKKFLELDALYNSAQADAQDYMAEFAIEFIRQNLRSFFKTILG